jgi:hypothetical protein
VGKEDESNGVNRLPGPVWGSSMKMGWMGGFRRLWIGQNCLNLAAWVYNPSSPGSLVFDATHHTEVIIIREVFVDFVDLYEVDFVRD